MKRILLGVILCMILCSSGVHAEEYTYSYTESYDVDLLDQWENLISQIPEDIRGEISDIDLDNPTESIDTVRDKVGFAYWAEKIFELLRMFLPSFIHKLLPLYVLVLVMAAVRCIVPFFSSSGVQNTFTLYTNLVSALFIIKLTAGVIDDVSVYLRELCGIMNVLTPVMEFIYLAGGAVSEAAVSSQAVTLLITLIGNFNGHILFPIANVLFIFSAVSMVCQEMNVGGFVDGLKRFILRLIQLMSIVFSFVLSSQSILARGADSLALKTARFAIGSLIPMAGGMISESLSTLTAGVSLLRGVAGIGGILTILLLFVRGLVPVFLMKIGIGIAESMAEMLKLSGFDSMLKEIHGILELLISIALYTSLMFLLTVILFAKSQGA